jgi:hypothetical protein
MTVNQQVQVPYTERRVQVAEQNADSQRISATRPPAGRAPRSQTELEYFQQIDKAGGPKTQGQKDFYKKYTQGKGRGSVFGGGDSPAPKPSTTIPGLRLVGKRPAKQ